MEIKQFNCTIQLVNAFDLILYRKFIVNTVPFYFFNLISLQF